MITIVLFFSYTFALSPRPSQGFEDTARLLQDPARAKDRILICSDSNSEGGFIVAVAMNDRRPQHIVLRTTKFLSENTWSEKTYHPRISTPQAVKEFLDEYQVDSIVIDQSLTLWEQDRQLLLAAIGLDPNWKILTDGITPGTYRHITVYRRQQDPNKKPGILRVPLSKTLQRDLTL